MNSVVGHHTNRPYYVSIHSLRLNHHSTVDEGLVVTRQSRPLMIVVATRQTRPQTVVEPPSSGVERGTVVPQAVVVVASSQLCPGSLLTRWRHVNCLLTYSCL